MAIDSHVLRTELLSSARAALYSASILRGDLGATAALVNDPATINASISIGVADALTLQQCVVVAEYVALAQAPRDLWNAIVTAAVGGISLSNTLIRAQVAGIWSAGTTTRSNLVSAQTRRCSPVEALSGEGAVADETNVYVALTQR